MEEYNVWEPNNRLLAVSAKIISTKVPLTIQVLHPVKNSRSQSRITDYSIYDVKYDFIVMYSTLPDDGSAEAKHFVTHAYTK
jgi:hypothetical protein